MNPSTETCDYCDAPVWAYQNFGRVKTCKEHVQRPYEDEMEKNIDLHKKELEEREEEDSSDEEEDGNKWFDRKYPNATCHRCNEKVDGESVVYCGGGGGACETWYCGDCHADGTEDCDVCREEPPKDGECVYCREEAVTHCDRCVEAETSDGGAMCRACANENGHLIGSAFLCGGCFEEFGSEYEDDEEEEVPFKHFLFYLEKELEKETDPKRREYLERKIELHKRLLKEFEEMDGLRITD